MAAKNTEFLSFVERLQIASQLANAQLVFTKFVQLIVADNTLVSRYTAKVTLYPNV